MYRLVAQDKRIIRLDAALLRKHFHYFDTTDGTASISTSGLYPLDFSFESLDRLDDALRELYPVMEREDELLLDYLQPIDQVSVYMMYTLSTDRMMEIGRQLPSWRGTTEDETIEEEYTVLVSPREDETLLLLSPSNRELLPEEPLIPVSVPSTSSPSSLPYLSKSLQVEDYLFLDAFPETYANYLSYVGIERLTRVIPVEKSLESFQHTLVISLLGMGGSDDKLEDTLRKCDLVKTWHGRTIEDNKLLQQFKEVVTEETIRRIYHPSTCGVSLMMYVYALCPSLAHKKPPQTLPWGITLEADDPRTMGIMAYCRGKIPLKSGPSPIQLAFDPEVDN